MPIQAHAARSGPPPGHPRPSRRGALLDAAARLFAERGYHGTSIRDIATAIAVTPGAIYNHHVSKARLLVAVYEEGVRRIASALEEAVAMESTPRSRLRAAAEAHLETLLDGSAYAAVMTRVLPRDVPEAEAELVELRDGYEQRFARIIAELPALDARRRRALRLTLLGALNGVQAWYRPGKGQGPAAIARQTVDFLLGEDGG
ncbi:MAG TPA: TetR/AcrR family transcriptional regulator [Anaeromyxobacteraceae bacterium]|nr:TetR/AcrR family transcriptional regulator [Anaeromyxobacteraceae bacterium]